MGAGNTGLGVSFHTRMEWSVVYTYLLFFVLILIYLIRIYDTKKHCTAKSANFDTGVKIWNPPLIGSYLEIASQVRAFEWLDNDTLDSCE